MRRMAIYVIPLAMTLAFAGVGHAEKASTSDNAKSDSAKTMASSDRKFITEAAKGGKAEVELGRLAGERGSSDAVKQFGQRMVTDHSKANDELAQLAQQKGITLPTDLDRSHKAMVDRLSKLNGAEFDRAYTREMVRDHDKDVKEFQREASKAKDSDVKSFASKTLPTLKEHQQQIRQLSASISGGKSPSTAGSASPATAPPASSK